MMIRQQKKITSRSVEPHGLKPVVPAVLRRNPPKQLQSSFAKASEDTRIPPRANARGLLRRRVKGLRIVIVAARYNAPLSDTLLFHAQRTLFEAGVRQVRTIRVPGSYEIPVVAMRLAKSCKYHAIITLGIVFQGKTSHAQHISTASAVNLQQIAMETGVPVIHQILTPQSVADARARIKLRGMEAAQTAIEMAQVMRSF